MSFRRGVAGLGAAALVLTGITVTALAFGGNASATEDTLHDVRVGTYNLSGVNADKVATGDHQVWRERRPVVVSQILAGKLDVVGLQEANQSSIYQSSLDYGVNQYLDLKGALQAQGAHYALTNEAAYNCVKPSSTYKCVYQDRDASNDNRIIYNTDRVSLVQQGSIQYAAQTAGKNTRFLVWAILQMKATGKRFFFTSTHLDPYDAGTRRAQWSELISDVNRLKGSLPVLTTGDFNFSKFDTAAETFLPRMKAEGYGDVAGQTYRSTSASGMRAETTRRAWVNSFNAYRRNVPVYSYWQDRTTKLGNGIDWIFATNSLRVKSYEVVVTMNTTTLQVKGAIPSDHSLVRATVVL